MARRFFIRLGVMLDSVPFRLKIIGLVLLITFMLGGVSAVELRRDMYQALSGELDFRGRSIARELAARAGDDLATRDLFGLYVLVDNSVRHNKDMDYAIVIDERGEVVVSTFPDRVPAALLAYQPDSDQAADESVSTLDVGGSRIREIRAPVYADSGTAQVRVGMSEDRIEETMELAVSRLMGMTIAAGVAAVLLGLLLVRLLLKPLMDIIDAMKRLARGDLAFRVKPSVDADLSFMASSFNEMAEKIEVRTDEGVESRRRVEVINRELTVLQRMSFACTEEVAPAEYLERCIRLSVSELAALGGWVCVRDATGESFCASEGTTSTRAWCTCRQTCLFSCRLHAGSAGDIPSDCPAYAFAYGGKGDVPSLRGLRVSLAELSARDGAEGVIALVHRRESFNADILPVLRAVAGQMEVVLENLMLQKDRESREKRLAVLLAATLEAQENERNRVARELHDDIGQQMTYLKLGLKVLAEGVKDEPERSALIDGLRETVSESIDAIRRAIADLGPAPLDDLGLMPALERLLRTASSMFGFKGDFQAVGGHERSLEPAVAVAAYRIVQEALSNAGRHSGCTQVSLVVRHVTGGVEIVVEDDGSGFDLDAVAADRLAGAHLGLDGMRERSEIVGGRLVVESTRGAGTTIHVRLPALAAEVATSGGVAHG